MESTHTRINILKQDEQLDKRRLNSLPVLSVDLSNFFKHMRIFIQDQVYIPSYIRYNIKVNLVLHHKLVF